MSLIYIIQAAVDRLLEQFEALKAYFENEADGSGMPSEGVKKLKAEFQNKKFKLYLEFLSYILDITCKMNLEFQSNEIRIHKLHSSMSGFYVSILRNFLKKSYIDRHLTDIQSISITDPHHYIDIDEMYVGPFLCPTQHIDRHDMMVFKKHVLSFYVELCIQIKRRFSFSNTVISNMEIIDPVKMSVQAYGSIAPLAKNFPNICSDLRGLDFEYRQIINLPIPRSTKIDVFWMDVFQMKNGANKIMFPKISKFVKAMFSLPHSTAEVERVFSKLNLIKTRLRNRLHVDTCEAILLSKGLLQDAGGQCYNFSQTKKVVVDEDHSEDECHDDLIFQLLNE